MSPLNGQTTNHMHTNLLMIENEWRGINGAMGGMGLVRFGPPQDLRKILDESDIMRSPHFLEVL